jgi:FkbM family methyltransferase
MANPTWKKFEQSEGFRRAKLAVRRLIGTELRLKPEIEMKTVEHSDWHFNPCALDGSAVIYSLGVGEETAFDEELIAAYGAEVHAFDPTPSTLAWLETVQLPDAFRFYPWAVTASDGTLTLYHRVKKNGSRSKAMLTMVPEAGAEDDAIHVPAYCLASIREKLDHDQIDLLKMDIEGAEYEVLDSLIDSEIRPTQLLVEFHHRFPSIGKEKTTNAIQRLREIGYRIFAVSANGREVSFYHQPAL